MNKDAEMEVDVVVVGAGAAGMTAAIVAAKKGLSVLLIEKAPVIGGSTAYSGGVVWVPGNHLAKKAGMEDAPEHIWQYLESCLGSKMDRTALQQYLDVGPEAIRWLEENSHVAFNLRPTTTDYFPELPGGTTGGRALEIKETDIRQLGTRMSDVRMPPDEYMVLGKMMVTVGDANQILGRYRSMADFKHTLKLVLRYALDRLSLHPRGTRVVVGNAMVTRMYLSLLNLHVPVWRNAVVRSLRQSEGRVTGLDVLHDGRRCVVSARRAVVLATGGFARSEGMRRTLFPAGAAVHTSVPESSTGDGIQLAMAAGAAMGARPSTPAFWTPASKVMRRDGSSFNFPHLMMDRSKPGVIAVNQAGRRFVNESTNYHDFAQVMLKQKESTGSDSAYLVSSQASMDKYCFGISYPSRQIQQALIKKGYLIAGNTVGELATKIGVPREALEQTIASFNANAAKGVDPDFGKGTTAYNRYLGDAQHMPNACLAPLSHGPFYAIRMEPGDIGTCYGLATDTSGRVLREDETVISGLYACGNDMNSIMGGAYPGPGITLGPAIAFGYAVSKHIVGEASASSA